MLPGPTIIKKCSKCSKLIKQYTISSGNTFGAKYWTDGKQEFPMLPDQPSLVKCPHCQATLWINELEEIDKIGRARRREDIDKEKILAAIEKEKENEKKYKNALRYKVLSKDEYLILAETGKPKSPEVEKYIRMQAWWAGNDARREQTDDIPLSPREATNLKAFAQLLDESNSDNLVMKAEIMRELGRFEDAKALLDKVDDSEILQAVSIIRNLVENKDPYVREMDFT